MSLKLETEALRLKSLKDPAPKSVDQNKALDHQAGF